MVKKTILRPKQNIPVISLQPKQLEYVNANQSIVYYGGGAGGGKTFGSLCDNLQFIHDPLYYSVFFRTTSTEIEKGLWPSAKALYMPYLTDITGKFIGKAKINEQQKTITWPSGARTTFAYLATDRDADSYYGVEITRIYYEEMQFRSAYQFEVLKSRNRSMANVPKGIRGTLNPDPQSFIYEWIKPFLDPEDYPIKELSGKTRYFVVVEGNLYTSWDEQELRDTWGKDPETYTYIPATLDDNKKLDELDPSYRKKLDSMPEAKRKQLLLGCWASTEETGIFFRRENLKKCSSIPQGALYCRAYDLASTADDTPATKGCDATANVMMCKTKDGYYYIMNGEHYRKRTGERDNSIIQQGLRDGRDVHIVIPKDSGAGGGAAFEYLSKSITEAGLLPKKDVAVATQSKLKKAEPFFTAVQNGLVFIHESGWDKTTLEAFYRELESFDGVTRSTRTRHDDFVDAVASAFSYLNRARVFTVPKLTALNDPTIKAQYDLNS
jgi:predicted phage terminase large subunit-like protein